MEDEDKILSREELIENIKEIMSDEITLYDIRQFEDSIEIDGLFYIFSSQISKWFLYLKIYLMQEDYEMCIYLRDVIKFDSETLVSIIYKHKSYPENGEEYIYYLSYFVQTMYNNINE